jgi:hypothetical protein
MLPRLRYFVIAQGKRLIPFLYYKILLARTSHTQLIMIYAESRSWIVQEHPFLYSSPISLKLNFSHC